VTSIYIRFGEIASVCLNVPGDEKAGLSGDKGERGGVGKIAFFTQFLLFRMGEGNMENSGQFQ
jgi:hypothetical protein